MNEAQVMEVFMEIQRGLPRQGPGSDDATRYALSFCTDLPEKPSVLDIGCGPGMQSLVLADALRGSITAVDLYQEYLDELESRATIKGLHNYIKPVCEDMTKLPFPANSFHLIWSEGAAYIMGVENALCEWKKFLAPTGYIVFSELLWLTDCPPDEAKQFFEQGYPAMSDIEHNKELISQAGYSLVMNFTIEDKAWWEAYYSPLAAKLPALREQYQDNDEALEFVDMAATEIEVRHKFGTSYGYEFFVAKLQSRK